MHGKLGLCLILQQSSAVTKGIVSGQRPVFCSIIQTLQSRQLCFTDWGMSACLSAIVTISKMKREVKNIHNRFTRIKKKNKFYFTETDACYFVFYCVNDTLCFVVSLPVPPTTPAMALLEDMSCNILCPGQTSNRSIFWHSFHVICCAGCND